MTITARQSTARTIMVGPVLDADGVAKTDLAVGGLKISKNGGAPAALDGSATLTHRNTGHYSLALTADDLDTVGQAEIVIDSTTNAMPIKTVTVIEEAVYDVLYAASATGKWPWNADWDAEVESEVTDALTAFTGDTGVTLAKALEMIAAFVAGKISVSSADGVATYTYKKRDGTTTSFTALCSETDGTRATTGGLS